MNLLRTVMGASRHFLPEFLKAKPSLPPQQHRAIWAITHCRTPAMGGRSFGCQKCGLVHFAFHSCNHKACPQCGRQATQDWVQRELAKRVDAPYFLVTFTLPSELRECFFGPYDKRMFDLFFRAVSGALDEKLAAEKGFNAHVNGFTAVLHTWNQQLLFHPHIHCLVPGAGLDARGQPVRVKNANYLLCLSHLQGAFKEHMRRVLTEHRWQVNPKVWNIKWRVNIQPVGSGAQAVKYLGAYVARTAIGDSRILSVDERSVTFNWTDRSDNNRVKIMSLPGVEFVQRYLRHVLPQGLRSIRYYGFCHPAAKANRVRVQFHTGMRVEVGVQAQPAARQKTSPLCPRCGGETCFVASLAPLYRQRGSPRAPPAPGSSQNPTALAA